MSDVRRTLREHPQLAEVGVVAVAIGLTVFVVRLRQSGLSVYPQLSSGTGTPLLMPDLRGVVPVLACVALYWRRRHPVVLALVLAVLSAVSPVVVPLLIALFTVASTCSGRITLRVTGAAVLPVVAYAARVPLTVPLIAATTVATAVCAVACVCGAVGWGLNVAGIRERAQRAEEEAHLRAEQARQHAREEIAREMHDVLAHRLTLLSVHAGALEFHPTASPAQVAEAVGVIRQSAGQALEDLQDVLRVLRAPTVDAHTEPPQPALGDVDRLIEEARAAGAALETHRDVGDVTTMDPTAGRAAYRIVQEALTNHRKHAPGGPLRLSLTGGAREGLTIKARNAIPPQRGARPRGGGQGLIGISERAALVGGTARHDLTDTGFSLEVWLPWTR